MVYIYRYDKTNPLLAWVVPRWLMSAAQLETMLSNQPVLTSHYDTFATLVALMLRLSSSRAGTDSAAAPPSQGRDLFEVRLDADRTCADSLPRLYILSWSIYSIMVHK